MEYIYTVGICVFQFFLIFGVNDSFSQQMPPPAAAKMVEDSTVFPDLKKGGLVRTCQV